MLKNTIAHVTGEAPSRTQLIKVHSVSWPQPKHREMQMIPPPTLLGAEEAERGSSELQPALCPWSCHCTHWLWLTLQGMLSQALLRAPCSCPALQVLCPGAQPRCTPGTAGPLRALPELSCLPRGEMLQINVLCDQLPVLVWLLN